MSSATDANSDGKMDIGGLRLIALSCLLLLVLSPAVAMSFNIAVFVTSFDVSFTEAGTVATIELGGIAVSSLFFSQIAPRLHPRKVYTLGIIAIALMNAATIFVPSIEALFVVRGIAGLAAGSVIAMVMYTAGHSRMPEKTFGIINSFVGVLSVILALVLPQAGKLYLMPGAPAGTSEADGLFLVYLVASVAALLFVRSVSSRPAFLLPVRVLGKLFRRLFLTRLLQLHEAGRLAFFGSLAPLAERRAFLHHLAPARKARWVVYAKPPFAGPQAVLAYLSRYTHRVAISNRRLLGFDEAGVTFR